MSADTSHRRLWIVWTLSTLGLAAWLLWVMTASADRSMFTPGPMSPGHHQIELACDACHTDPWGGTEAIQEACVGCHGDERKKPLDSHPRTKFTDPRNADRLEHIDALRCVTCHVEHRPEITAANGVTQPRDLCFHCHAEIAEERPSHAGMAFDTCLDAGCHNFHNNRALYTDFLLKHLDEPDLQPEAVLPARDFASAVEELMDYPRDRYPVTPLSAEDADGPAGAATDPVITADWLATAHARSGVNCSACHVLAPTADDSEARWTDHPDERGCAQCHDLEVERFARGRHGMRGAVGLPPMTPRQARLPMRADAADTPLTCVTCHGAHRFDAGRAAVEACLECHDDRHSRSYEGSPHHAALLRERAGELPAGSGVSCAGCHMPRIDFDVNEWTSRLMVDHNQSANFSPNSKMIRTGCLHCHGLPFTLDALADEALIERNFDGRPAVHVESMALARADLERAEKERREARAAPDG